MGAVATVAWDTVDRPVPRDLDGWAKEETLFNSFLHKTLNAEVRNCNRGCDQWNQHKLGQTTGLKDMFSMFSPKLVHSVVTVTTRKKQHTLTMGRWQWTDIKAVRKISTLTSCPSRAHSFTKIWFMGAQTTASSVSYLRYSRVACPETFPV